MISALGLALLCTSGEKTAAPCETPLMETNSSRPALEEQPSTIYDPQPHTPPADSHKIAFKLGGSEEADLDNNEMETKDLDLSNGEKEIITQEVYPEITLN